MSVSPQVRPVERQFLTGLKNELESCVGDEWRFEFCCLENHNVMFCFFREHDCDRDRRYRPVIDLSLEDNCLRLVWGAEKTRVLDLKTPEADPVSFVMTHLERFRLYKRFILDDEQTLRQVDVV